MSDFQSILAKARKVLEVEEFKDSLGTMESLGKANESQVNDSSNRLSSAIMDSKLEFEGQEFYVESKEYLHLLAFLLLSEQSDFNIKGFFRYLLNNESKCQIQGLRRTNHHHPLLDIHFACFTAIGNWVAQTNIYISDTVMPNMLLFSEWYMESKSGIEL